MIEEKKAFSCFYLQRQHENCTSRWITKLSMH